MATSNSKASEQLVTPTEYDDFSTNLSYDLNRLKAMISGATSLVYACEREFTAHPQLLDAVYILGDVTESASNLATVVSNTEFKYVLKDAGQGSDGTPKENVQSQFNSIYLALAGLKEHSTQSQVQPSDIEALERVVFSARDALLAGL